MDEIFLRLHLEEQCSKVLRELTIRRKSLIDGIKLKEYNIVKNAKLQAGVVLAKLLGKINNSYVFWSESAKGMITGHNTSISINKLFPQPQDMALKDLYILLKNYFYIKTKNYKLEKDQMYHNEDLINDLENQFGWLFLLNRHRINLLSSKIKPGIQTSFEGIKKDLNVLNRHKPTMKTYSPLSFKD